MLFDATEGQDATVVVAVYVPEADTVIEAPVAELDQVVAEPVEEVKVTEPPWQNVVAPPEVMVGAAGAAFTVIYPVWLDAFDPPAFVAVNVTFYVPAVGYVTTWLAEVDEEGVPPGNDQLYDVGLLVEVLVNVTD